MVCTLIEFDSQRKRLELDCLEATRKAFSEYRARDIDARIKSVELVGEYPDTAVEVIYEFEGCDIVGGLDIWDEKSPGEYVSMGPDLIASIIITNSEEIGY